MSAASTVKRRLRDDTPGSNFQTELSRAGAESSLAGDASRRERRKRRRVNDVRAAPVVQRRSAPLVLTAVHDHVRTLEVSVPGVDGARKRQVVRDFAD